MKSKDKTQPENLNSYSTNPKDYKLIKEIGNGATATVYIAVYLPLNSTVAVKVVNLEGFENSIKEVQTEIAVMIQCSHPNVVQYYSSFVNKMELWIVMRLLDVGSVLDIIKFSETDGLEEVSIATILKETLKALHYFHSNGHIHRDLKAGNILIDTDGTIQLADFGVSSCFSLPHETRKTFAGTPCWMAPEVMEQSTGYNFKADIWSIGITAIELATGFAPHSNLPPVKVMLAILNEPAPTLNLEKYPNFSKTFKKMIDLCLQKDPYKRPTAEQLLKHDFFKKAKGKDYVIQHIIPKIPPLSERKKNIPLSDNNNNKHNLTPDEDWDYNCIKEDNNTEILSLNLRLRNKEGKLHDIKFPFNLNSDSPDEVSCELVEHGILPKNNQKEVSVAISEFLKNKTPIRFEIQKLDENENSDINTLVGYALLSLVSQV